MFQINPINVAKLLYEEINLNNYDASEVTVSEIELKNYILGKNNLLLNCIYYLY